MPIDKKMNNLILNEMTKEKYEELKAAGQISADEFYMITDDENIVANGAKGVDVTLDSANWTQKSDGTYYQTVSVAGVTADNENIVDINLSGSDINADIEVMKAWGCVNRAAQSAGNITFFCYGDIPTVNIPISVVVM